jgi:hypothetical protein
MKKKKKKKTGFLTQPKKKKHQRSQEAILRTDNNLAPSGGGGGSFSTAFESASGHGVPMTSHGRSNKSIFTVFATKNSSHFWSPKL